MLNQKGLHLLLIFHYSSVVGHVNKEKNGKINVVLALLFSPMVRETGVQSQVESYQRLEKKKKKKKWYLIPPCLTLSTIKYTSRVKWSNPGKGVPPSPTPRCSSY